MRKPIIAGNWKMNMAVGEALSLVDQIKPLVANTKNVDVVVCPPYTALYPVGQALSGTNIGLGAQDVFWKGSGAYTSRISLPMLIDLGVKCVILGHSETRGRFGAIDPEMTTDLMRTFGETDAGVNIKAKAVVAAGLTAIICIGETLEERNNELTDAVVTGQVTRALQDISAAAISSQVVFAYEPVWAIGTGEVCAVDEADRVCGVVRQAVSAAATQSASEKVRVQYGGSMKPDNAAALLARPNIDGGLIGGAALKATDFAAIVSASR